MTVVDVTLVDVLVGVLLIVVSGVGALMGRTMSRLERNSEAMSADVTGELRRTRSDFVGELKGLRGDIAGLRSDMGNLSERVRATEVGLATHVNNHAQTG